MERKQAVAWAQVFPEMHMQVIILCIPFASC